MRSRNNEIRTGKIAFDEAGKKDMAPVCTLSRRRGREKAGREGPEIRLLPEPPLERLSHRLQALDSRAGFNELDIDVLVVLAFLCRFLAFLVAEDVPKLRET